MGHRAQNNFDDAEREACKRLPFRDRWDWRLLGCGLVILAAFVAGLVVRFCL
jgi:hypothetical protein